MQDASFVEASATGTRAALPAGTRIVMMLFGYVPLVHTAGTIAVLFAPWPLPLRIAAALFVLFLLPPLMARAVRLRQGTFGPGDPRFLRWWLTSQLQTLFNRIPVEEAIRLVPALYSAWLRLWGSSIGSFVYWSPHAVILDRGLLRVGDAVIIGAGARLAGHLLTRETSGELQLLVAPVTIGKDAVIGGWALIGPGATISEGTSFPAGTALPPFRIWSGGRRLPRTRAF